MSRKINSKINSLLMKSARIRSHIESERVRSRPDWIVLLRLKLLDMRLRGRLRALAAAAVQPVPPARFVCARA